MLRYREHLCRLESPVHCVWELRGFACEQQRVVADGRVEMVFHLANAFQQLDGCWEKQPESALAGQLTQPLIIRPAGETHTIGIRFKSWASAATSPSIPRDLGNTVTEAAFVHRRMTRSLLEVVRRNSRDLAALARELDRFLARNHPADPRVVAAAQLAERLQGQCAVDELARAAEVGSRQLERLFNRYVGVRPKSFLRIQRFSSVFRHVSAKTDWAAVAAACGYADQSHLTKDFQQFAGGPPAAMIAEGSDMAFYFTALA